MTDEIDPIRDHLPADVSASTARDYAAALVKNGMDAGKLNASLAARGFAPLDTGSAEYAEAVRDAKLKDPKVRDAILGGDAAALLDVTLHSLRAERNDGSKLTGNALAPVDYSGTVELAIQSSGVAFDGPAAATYAAEVQAAASDLQMPAAHVTALVENQLRELEQAARLTKDERSLRHQDNERQFMDALGADADKQITDAQAHISKARNKSVDLKGCAKAYGPLVALQLFHQAQAKMQRA